MTPDTLPNLTNALRQLHLLSNEQLETCARELEPQFPEPRALAREMVRRGLLTPYQVNQLFLGRGEQLLLGSYVLLERIGEGGMGTVFKARNWKLDKTVAIKVIKKDRLTKPDTIKRFYREIRAVAQLDHPNIVRAYDADEVQGNHFFVMEFVEGIDLHQVVKKRGPLPSALACEYVRQAALGLQHAFERGMVHRDIKPHNLLLAAGGPLTPTPLPLGERGRGEGRPQAAVKVLDMGLALVETPTNDDHSGTMTHSGIVMGTPDYMAPEQSLDAHDVDIRADLYSLGCTLYFLLTGRAPFSGGTLTSKLLRHQHDEPETVKKHRPDLPDTIEALVHKLLAKRREDRYQTPLELAWALEQIQSGSPLDDSRTVVDSPIQVAMTPTNAPSHTAIVVREGWAEIAPALAPGERPPARVPRLAIVLACLGVLAVFGGIWWATRPSPGKSEPDPEPIVHRPKPRPTVDPPKQTNKAFWFGPATDEWVKAVRDLPAEKQAEVVFKKLKELNPGFDDQKSTNKYEIKDGVVVEISFDQAITDLSPIQALGDLQSFTAYGRGSTGFAAQPPIVSLADLSPLRGLPLKRVKFWSQRLHDLSPLAEAPLESVDIANTQVSDLSPLRKCPLRHLNASDTLIRDLSPLQDMTTLQFLSVRNTPVREVAPLAGLKNLNTLDLSATGVRDLAPLRQLPLQTLRLNDTAVEDLAALADMPLRRLTLEGTPVKSFAPLQKLTGLEYLSGDLQPARDASLVGNLIRLKELNDLPVEHFLKRATPDKEAEAFAAKVAALKPSEQVDAVCERLRVLNGFPFQAFMEQANGAVSVLILKRKPDTNDSIPLTDLSPLAALNHLKQLEIVDISFERLSLWPLRNLRLEKLHVLCGSGPIDDLNALTGMPLKSLTIHAAIRSLAPLRGLPLEELQCKWGLDLSPLRGMPLKRFTQMWGITGNLDALAEAPLEHISIGYVEERHGAVLRGMKTLKKFGIKTADDFWKEQAEQQVEFVRREMMRLNGKLTKFEVKIKDGVVFDLRVGFEILTDLSPLKNLTGLTVLQLHSEREPQQRIAFEPLREMKLQRLNLGGMLPVDDLSFVRGMPLTSLSIDNPKARDLTPLEGKPLTHLTLPKCKAISWIPLKGMKLTSFVAHGSNFDDLSLLRDMPLNSVNLHFTPISDLSPLKGMKIDFLHIPSVKVTDYSVLRDMSVKSVHFDIVPWRDSAIIRASKTLEIVNGKPAKESHAWADWEDAVRAASPEKQVEMVTAKLKELNPDFDGKVKPRYNKDGKIDGLTFLTDKVQDISPVRALPALQSLCVDSSDGRGKLSSLEPLIGLTIYDLTCDLIPARDTAILKQIKTLKTVNGFPISDVLK